MRDLLELISFVAAAFVAIAMLTWVALTFAWYYEDLQCRGQWERSGMRSEYTRIEGCMVQRHDGTWVPASTLRSLES